MTKIIWSDNLKSSIYQDALAIRYKVFVDEQKVPSDLEIDELEDQSIHGVLYHFDQAVATVRLYPMNSRSYKVQRVAVLKEFRNKGFGKAIMEKSESKAKEDGIELLELDSQNQALPFYKKLGYEIISGEFLDAGILHHKMNKRI